MDAVGVFGYSDEDGTAAADLPGKLGDDEIADRVERVTSLVEELTSQRAEDRIGTEMLVLVDADPAADLLPTGDRAADRIVRAAGRTRPPRSTATSRWSTRTDRSATWCRSEVAADGAST